MGPGAIFPLQLKHEMAAVAEDTNYIGLFYWISENLGDHSDLG